MQPRLTIFGPHIDHGGYYVINDVTELNIVVNHRIQKKKKKINKPLILIKLYMAYTGISCNDQHEIIVNPCSQMCLYFPSVSALRAVLVY